MLSEPGEPVPETDDVEVADRIAERLPAFVVIVSWDVGTGVHTCEVVRVAPEALPNWVVFRHVLGDERGEPQVKKFVASPEIVRGNEERCFVIAGEVARIEVGRT
ncbi:hypothetical protein HRbin27_01313 [bacterium HR27]|nr:hypothetical protein HRbin27_01313 [bacterium HR27]